MPRDRLTPLPDVLRADLARRVETLTLSRTFFEDRVERRLARRPLLEVRRSIAASRDDAWSTLVEPSWISSATGLSAVRIIGGPALEPGTRVRAIGRIADRIASRDETIFTRVEPGDLIAWTTRSAPRGLPGCIEFRWSIELVETETGCEGRHQLWGVAFPPGLPGRLLRGRYERVEGAMFPSMHRGFERLATLIETRAR